MPLIPHAQLQEMFNNKQFREAIDVSANEPSMFSYIVHAALAEAPRGYASMERALEDAAEDRTVRMLRDVEWLNLLGNVGPMMGLLGTVWGMILAFFKIVEAGTVNASMLAGALGVKLVCTLVGLIVAIPSLSVYGITRNKIDILSSEAVVNAQALILTFRPGKKAE
jgi:biopolymer transport protein ExbB